MKKSLLFYFLSCLLFIGISCTDEEFNEGTVLGVFEEPTGLNYPTQSNANEFGAFRTSPPTVDTNGFTPFFEIISIRNAAGETLDASFLEGVNISNPTTEFVILNEENTFVVDGENINLFETENSSQAGVITFEDKNMFGFDQYFFTIRVTIENDGQVLSTTFNDALQVNFNPELVRVLRYLPLAQNLVPGTTTSSTIPEVIRGNPDVTYSLGDNTDLLTIDANTGQLSLRSDITITDNVTIQPTVIATNNTLNESVSFSGDQFLSLVLSNTPVELMPRSIFFFQPTFEERSPLFGFAVDVITPGGVPDNRAWETVAPSPLANQDDNLPEIDNMAIQTNAVVAGMSLPHESDAILTTQNLSDFEGDFDLKFVFYYQNRFVEYLSDGRTPTELEVFYATDFDGTNNGTANWMGINEILSCQIESLDATPFIGLPYPGDQRGDDPDNRKDSTRNADGRWVRCELDVTPFANEENFTIKFKYNSFFEGSISGATGRAGRYLISDAYFEATER